MSLILRQYQRDGIGALWNFLRTQKGNPVLVAPTGAGKGVILSQVIKDAVAFKGRVLLLAHVAELLEQSAKELQRNAPEITYGIYSAGLGSKDAGYDVVIASIQSAYRDPDAFGHRDLILIDECHRVKAEDDGMYRGLIKRLTEINPDIRVAGFSATPYRTSSGLICGPDNLFTEICHETFIKPLIAQGYLSRLISKTSRLAPCDTSGLHIRAGEFVQEEVDLLMNDESRVIHAVMEIMEKTLERNSVLIFCSSVKHALYVAGIIAGDVSPRVACVFGDTPSEERAETIRKFKSGEIKYLVNVNVLTEGFDAPAVDTVVLLRPTASPGLFYQMCGRGFRIAPGKKDCLILDFGNNILRHGPVDLIRPARKGEQTGTAPAKTCPECFSVIHASYQTCPECGYVFPPPERGVTHEAKAGEHGVISGEPETYLVDSVAYWLHRKKNAPESHPPTLRVEYRCEGGLVKASEFVCLEHTGFARQKACGWWMTRMASRPPGSIKAALEEIDRDGIKEPQEIVIASDGKYFRIIKVRGLEHRAPRTNTPSPSPPPVVEPEEEVEEDLFQ